MYNRILYAQGLEKNFNGVKALSNFSFSLSNGEILGLIGPNGAGKTTLFNVLTGYVPSECGEVLFKGASIIGHSPYQIANLGIARTFQNLRLAHKLSLLDNILFAFRDQPGERLGYLFFRPGKCHKIEVRNQGAAIELITAVGLIDNINNNAETLSYGQQKLLSLICCLAANAEILLLDEPVAGIDPEMTEKILAIIRRLSDKGISIILIEHNLDAVIQVCDRVIFMEAGAKVCEGTPYEVKNDPSVIRAYIG